MIRLPKYSATEEFFVGQEVEGGRGYDPVDGWEAKMTKARIPTAIIDLVKRHLAEHPPESAIEEEMS